MRPACPSRLIVTSFILEGILTLLCALPAYWLMCVNRLMCPDARSPNFPDKCGSAS